MFYIQRVLADFGKSGPTCQIVKYWKQIESIRAFIYERVGV